MLKPRVYKQANDTSNEITSKMLLIMVLIFGVISDNTKEEATIEGAACCGGQTCVILDHFG